MTIKEANEFIEKRTAELVILAIIATRNFNAKAAYKMAKRQAWIELTKKGGN